MVTFQLTRAAAERRARMLRWAAGFIEEKRWENFPPGNRMLTEIQQAIREMAELLEEGIEGARLDAEAAQDTLSSGTADERWDARARLWEAGEKP